MLKFNFPYTELDLNSQTKILLDACFLLSLQDESHKDNESCGIIANYLASSNCKLFVSNVVIAEVINKLIFRFFMMDIGYRFSELTLNNNENINKLVTYFYSKERNIILNGTKEQFEKYSFSNHIDFINKKTSDRNLLKIYFEEAIDVMDDLEEDLSISILPINSNMVALAKELSSNYLMGINDAQHIAVSISHRMDYILTLDGDFEKIPIDKVKILTTENINILESTGTDNQ